MNYVICWGETVEGLEKAVNEHIAEGYKPIGGLIVTQETEMAYGGYYQAVLKEGKCP